LSGKKVILMGATGMVGGCALRTCIDDPDVSLVTVVGVAVLGLNTPNCAKSTTTTLWTKKRFPVIYGTMTSRSIAWAPAPARSRMTRSDG
jgi:hypothetical protein